MTVKRSRRNLSQLTNFLYNRLRSCAIVFFIFYLYTFEVALRAIDAISPFFAFQMCKNKSDVVAQNENAHYAL